MSGRRSRSARKAPPPARTPAASRPLPRLVRAPSSLRRARLTSVPIWLWVSISALLSTMFYLRLEIKPSSFDASAYVASGKAIAESGLFSKWPQSELRTYGYPWFVSLVDRVAVPASLPTEGLVFLVQLLLHIGACLLLYAALRPLAPRAAAWALPLLLCNPYLLAFVPETLTESLTISLTIAWLAGLAPLCRPTGPAATLTLWAALGGISGIALMIRPANLTHVAATVAVAVALLSRNLLRDREHAARHLGAVTLLAVCLALPLAPQVKINDTHYGTASPLPSADLGDFQLRTGVEYLKYATDLRVEGGQAAPYLNPFLGPEGKEAVPEQPLDYYWQQPWDGLRVLALHAFNSVNPDFLFTYVYDRSPWYRVPMVLAVQLLIFTGVITVVAAGWRTLRQRRGDAWPLLLGVAALAGVNLALNSVVAVEARFGVVAVVALSLAVGCLPALWRTWGPRARAAWAVGAVLWLSVALWLTYWVLAQAPVLQAGP